MPELENKKEQEIWWRKPLLMFAELSGWIAFPVIMAVFLGKWLDDRYGTKPWLFLLAVGVAFVISTIGIVRSAMDAMNQIDQFNNKDNKNKDNARQ